MRAPPHVVLDTNVVLSALLFGSAFPARLREAWQAVRVVPVASAATAQELVRVLAYPKFKLSTAEQQDLLADYLPWVRVVRIPAPPPATPPCRDPFDLPFLHLAIAGKAHALVSGDKDLLELAGSPGLCPVLTIESFCRELA